MSHTEQLRSLIREARVRNLRILEVQGPETELARELGAHMRLDGPITHLFGFPFKDAERELVITALHSNDSHTKVD